MPLEKTIQVNTHTQVLVWKITESFESLQRGLALSQNSAERLQNMKSISHQCGFLSIRHLLFEAGYQDADLTYDENGRPHLNDGKFISITHSFSYSAIIVSSHNVGIDIEMQREKIIRIADKFTNLKEQALLVDPIDSKVKQLTIIWGAKEAMYKMCNSRSLSFKDNMNVEAFDLIDECGRCEVSSESFSKSFYFYFFEIENFILVYTLL
ncbi:4'-phosphopantetheinyl transferase superfamily protein [Flavobacterium sp. HSC-61S13]|uniref:4'-phosphopantetheinyl transferase family protein n=1 Tax=Flavobacterium sp. HSC-61S13 TaxID=2910963 RepID=UPI00209C9E93|nr:4'-phosphopantetheinyl transferase superfamily protein [Flavobacterium sp. HSC-61S13]MCP1995012.1 4'-phosphopantetheinyl transferase EntD [Flavobacterium sp. HSC-61S13]